MRKNFKFIVVSFKYILALSIKITYVAIELSDLIKMSNIQIINIVKKKTTQHFMRVIKSLLVHSSPWKSLANVLMVK